MRIIGELPDYVHGVSCYGDLIISASGYGEVVVWKDGKRAAGFGGPRGVCWMGAMSKNGTVAAGFGDCTIQLWDGKKQKQLAQLGGIVASLAWSADGKKLLTGNCGDNTIRLWQDGKEIWSGKTKKSGTWFVALSADGKRALSGAGDKLIHVWDVGKGEREPLSGHTGKILGLAMVGNRAASASQDRTARVWNLAKSTSIALQGHKKQVLGVAFSSDGDQIATVSGDRTLRIWDANSGEELRCEKLEEAPASVAWGEEIIVAAGKKILAF
jgi:WD40 repeat protein